MYATDDQRDQGQAVQVIERSSSTPYYEQLYDVLLERIKEGALAVGDQIPGESQLHREFGLSRATVRQALDLLESNGYAQKVPRRGYFVSSPQAPQGWLIEGAGGFLENGLGHSSPRVTTTVVSARRTALPDDAAKALQIPSGSIGLILERVRRVDGQIALFSTNYLPTPVADAIAGATGVTDGTSALTMALQDAGYAAAGARRVVHAMPAPPAIAAHLQLADWVPLLRIRSTTWGKSGVPHDYYETWLRTDVVPLEIDAVTT